MTRLLTFAVLLVSAGVLGAVASHRFGLLAAAPFVALAALIGTQYEEFLPGRGRS